MIPKTPLPVCTVKFSTVSPVLSGLSVKYVSSGLAQSVLVQLQIKQVKSVMQDGPGEKPTAATPESGLKPYGHFRLQQVKQCTYFIGRDIAGLGRNRFSTTKSGRAKNRLCPQGLKSAQ